MSGKIPLFFRDWYSSFFIGTPKFDVSKIFLGILHRAPLDALCVCFGEFAVFIGLFWGIFFRFFVEMEQFILGFWGHLLRIGGIGDYLL